MTFDEAFDHPGPLLAAWSLTSVGGTRTLTLYALDGGRARPLVSRGVAAGEEDAVDAMLHARGIAAGAYDGACDFVWMADEDGVTVWAPNGRVLDARGETLSLGGGRTIQRAEVERVEAYAEEDYVERGVRARLRSGEIVPLARDLSSAAAADPTYTRNELLYDTEWAGAIAAAVAAWAGVLWDDLI